MFGNEKPIARTSDLVVQPLEGELLIYDLERHRAMSLNEMSATIWNSCDGTKTIEDIVRAVGDENVVSLALADLEKNNLLDPMSYAPAELTSSSRRELISAIGRASVAAIPVILAITAPRAIDAASCVAIGAFCSISSVCCVNNVGIRCCKNNACSNGSGSCASG